jgi:early secretory antigenic target protein ESAT-6
VTERLVVVFGSLGDLTDGLEQTAERLQEHLSELDAALARIAQSWEGAAHDAFRQRFNEWRTTSRDLHQTLRKLHQLTTTAHGNYSAAENANLRMWGAV